MKIQNKLLLLAIASVVVPTSVMPRYTFDDKYVPVATNQSEPSEQPSAYTFDTPRMMSTTAAPSRYAKFADIRTASTMAAPARTETSNQFIKAAGQHAKLAANSAKLGAKIDAETDAISQIIAAGSADEDRANARLKSLHQSHKNALVHKKKAVDHAKAIAEKNAQRVTDLISKSHAKIKAAGEKVANTKQDLVAEEAAQAGSDVARDVMRPYAYDKSYEESKAYSKRNRSTNSTGTY